MGKARLFSQLIAGNGTIKATKLGEDVPITEKVTTASALPSSASVGEQAFVQDTNRLYIWNGSGWYNIALINTNPTWTSQPLSAYTLDNVDLNPTTVTIVANDPEGIPIQYSYETGGSMDSMATISQDSGVFTITPKSLAQLDSDNGPHTGSITFKASDGINVLPSVSNFTLTFIAPTPEWDTYSLTGNQLRSGAEFQRYMGCVVEMSGNGRYVAVSNGMDPYTNGRVQIWHDTDGNGSWTKQAEYNYAAANDFGSDLSFDDEGETLVVGEGGASKLRVYTRSGTTWTEDQVITGTANFGLAVGLSGNGLEMIIAEPAYNSNRGRLHSYSRTDKSTDFSVHQQMSSITGHTANNSYLGRTAGSWRTNYSAKVEVNEDGTRFVVACSGYNNSTAARAYLFTRGNAGDTWSNNTDYIKRYHVGSEKGVSDVAISGDGNTMVVGKFASTAGQFFIFDITSLPSTATLTPTQTINWSGLSSSEKGSFGNSYWFGSLVSVSRDGKTIVTSALTYSASYLSGMGSVYIFRKNDSTGNWDWKAVLEPGSTSDQNRFGSAVNVSNDGTHIAIGEYRNDDGNSDNGVFYIYKATS